MDGVSVDSVENAEDKGRDADGKGDYFVNGLLESVKCVFKGDFDEDIGHEDGICNKDKSGLSNGILKEE